MIDDDVDAPTATTPNKASVSLKLLLLLVTLAGTIFAWIGIRQSSAKQNWLAGTSIRAGEEFEMVREANFRVFGKEESYKVYLIKSHQNDYRLEISGPCPNYSQHFDYKPLPKDIDDFVDRHYLPDICPGLWN